MKKVCLWFTLVLLFVFVGSTGVVWAGEGTSPATGTLTRGEFAALLVEAGGLAEAGDISPAELLVQKGIMQGYPGGDLCLDRRITWAEGATLAAKSLGLKGDLGLFPGADATPDSEGYPDWSYSFAAWLQRFGLVTGDPSKGISKTEAKSFLEKMFSTDPEVAKILEKAEVAFTEVETFRSKSSGQMKIIPRPGVEGAEEIAGTAMEMQILQEMILPGKLHQESTVTVNLPAGLPELPEKMEISTEMYMLDGKIYMQISDPETGEAEWFIFPDGLLPGLEKVFDLEKQMEIIPPELEDLLSYQLLGNREIDGENVYEVAFYGCIDDLGKLMEAAFNMLGDAQQLQPLIEQSAAAIDAISIWGVQYIDQHSYTVKGIDLAFILTFAEEMFGEPNPLKAMQISMQIEEYEVNAAVNIELPAEAAAASLMELPELPGT